MTSSQPNGRSDQGSSSTLKGTRWASAKQAGAASANARAASARKGPGGDPDPAARHHQEGAARPEPEEGGADHQEREVVPLDDREQPGE